MVTFRKAEESDYAQLYEWRNDALSLASKGRSEPYSRDESDAMNRKLNGRLYIAEDGNAPIGTVIVTPGEKEVELAWGIIPPKRELGFGKKMVKEAMGAFTGHKFARIRTANKASQKIAEYAGMKRVSDGPIQRWEQC